jgi:GR25 family glycosyltransferase involved in LPS biosynthesis
VKLNELFPLIYYINMDSRPDRMMQAQEEFKKLDIAPERISGKIFTGTNDPHWNAVHGCTLSHSECLQRAKRENKNVFIFEDDLKLVNNFEDVISQALDELVNFEWDMFYLGANILKPVYQVDKHLAQLSHGQSTVAYGVNVNFIDFLSSKIPSNKIIPIDMIYAELVVPYNNCYISYPMTVIQRDGYSDIEKQDVQYESYLERRFYENLVKMDGNNGS